VDFGGDVQQLPPHALWQLLLPQLEVGVEAVEFL
jgi:hypothetical protein